MLAKLYICPSSAKDSKIAIRSFDLECTIDSFDPSVSVSFSPVLKSPFLRRFFLLKGKQAPVPGMHWPGYSW